MCITPKNIIELIQEAGILVDLNDIDSSIKLRDQGLDSLDMMNLFMHIEERFNISISDENYKKLLSVDEIVDYLNDKLSSLLSN